MKPKLNLDHELKAIADAHYSWGFCSGVLCTLGLLCLLAIYFLNR